MSPKVSVFLLSYNKGEYVLDAMRSVFAQTMTDWELWLLENSNDGVTHEIVANEIDRYLESFSGEPLGIVHYERLEGEEVERQRKEKYIATWLLNVYLPEAFGDYAFILSDDDLIDADCFEVMAGELDANPSHHVVYAGLRTTGVSSPGEIGPFPDAGIPARDVKSFPGSVDSRIDGGQIMFRKTCLDHLVPPYWEETSHGSIARHSDGVFMERLVGRFPFWPIDKYLITHRYTSLSTWDHTHER
jgi:spore maturation protein CgeD